MQTITVFKSLTAQQRKAFLGTIQQTVTINGWDVTNRGKDRPNKERIWISRSSRNAPPRRLRNKSLFPEVVMKLAAAGVERYIVDIVGKKETHLRERRPRNPYGRACFSIAVTFRLSWMPLLLNAP